MPTDPQPQSDSDRRNLARDAGQYWSASGESDTVRDLSHWKGIGRFSDPDTWYATGTKHVAMVHALRRQIQSTHPIDTMMEWGQGGGANAVAFATHVKRLLAVDISAANLQECGRQLQAIGFTGYTPIHIAAEAPEAVLAHVPDGLDLFLSTAVFQHFPSREYGRTVTGLVARMLKPGAIALIQIRYDDGNPKWVSKTSDYKTFAKTFTSYPISEYWNICAEVGLTPVSVALVPATNYAYFSLVREA